jgi:hypothetical protein
VKVDEAYLKESIQQPGAKLVAGYDDVMPPGGLEAQDLEAMVAYIRSLAGQQAGEDHERDEHAGEKAKKEKGE